MSRFEWITPEHCPEIPELPAVTHYEIEITNPGVIKEGDEAWVLGKKYRVESKEGKLFVQIPAKDVSP
jgi:hypothetical protein